MNEIVLKSEYPCLIVNENEQVFLEEHEILNLSTNKNVYIYPVSKQNLLPFKIDFSAKSKFYHVFEYEKKFYCFLPSFTTISKKSIEKLKIDGKTLAISLCEKEMSFSLDDHTLTLPLHQVPNEYEISSIEDFAVMLLKNEDCEKLVLFNINNSSFKFYTSPHFEIKNSEIKFENKYKDFSNLSQNCTLKISKGKIDERKEDVKTPDISLNEQLLCYGFLDAIKEKNFLVAKKLLTSEKQNVEDEKLQGFFENFLSYFQLTPNVFAIIYPFKTKILHFKLSDGKISDFSFE